MLKTSPDKLITTAAQEFADLFSACVYRPIIKRGLGWVKLAEYVSSARLQQLILSRGAVIGVRPVSKTQYLMIDLDWKEGKPPSPYHPFAEGSQFRDLLFALEEIGLCRHLIVNSSATSQGVHVYFPLAEKVSSIELGRRVTQYLEESGFAVARGILEVFPNRKNGRAYFQGHSVPLQQSGTYIWGSDHLPIGSTYDLFVAHWLQAAGGQDYECFHQFLTKKEESKEGKGLRQYYHDLFVTGMTGAGQSNEIGRKLAYYGLCALGLTTEDKLTAYIQAQWPRVPGYQQYASQETKEDTGWARRKAKSILRSGFVPVKNAGKYPSGLPQKPCNPNLNEQRRKDALLRLRQGLQAARQQSFQFYTRLVDFLRLSYRLSKKTLYKQQYVLLIKAAFALMQRTAGAKEFLALQQQQLQQLVRSYSPAARSFCPSYTVANDLCDLARHLAQLYNVALC